MKYQLVGTAPNRKLVVEFKEGYYYGASNAELNWQVQLSEGSNAITIVYNGNGSSYLTSYSGAIGLATSASDLIRINPSNHVATYYTAEENTLYNVWPGNRRYYEFVIPNDACARPVIASAVANAYDATLSWYSGASNVSTYTAFCGTDTAYGITDTFYTFTGLTHNTPYVMGVQADCGTDSLSRWVRRSVRTSCVALTDQDLPFTDGFESYETGASDQFIFCWNRLGYSQRPYVYNGSGHTGGKSLYFYGRPNSYDAVVLPELDLTSLSASDLSVSFWARQYSSSYDCDIEVGVMTDPTNWNTYTPLRRVHPLNASYEYFSVPLTDYEGTGAYIAMAVKNHPGNMGYLYMYVDDITIDFAPSCLMVDSLQLVSNDPYELDATWTPVDSESSWIVQLRQGSTLVDAQEVTTPSVSWNTLDPGTLYTLSVAANCGGDTGAVVRTSCYTQCLPVSAADLPYTYGFEDVAGSGSAYPINACWTKGTNYTTAYPYASTTNHSGSYSLYWYWTTSYYSYAVMPAFEDDIANLQVRFSGSTTPAPPTWATCRWA